MTIRLLLGTALTGAVLAASAPAQAAPTRVLTVCAAQATLYETPGGAKVGILHHGDRVRVLARGSDGRWWRVAAAFGTRGWLRAGTLCGRRK